MNDNQIIGHLIITLILLVIGSVVVFVVMKIRIARGARRLLDTMKRAETDADCGRWAEAAEGYCRCIEVLIGNLIVGSVFVPKLQHALQNLDIAVDLEKICRINDAIVEVKAAPGLAGSDWEVQMEQGKREIQVYLSDTVLAAVRSKRMGA